MLGEPQPGSQGQPIEPIGKESPETKDRQGLLAKLETMSLEQFENWLADTDLGEHIEELDQTTVDLIVDRYFTLAEKDAATRTVAADLSDPAYRAMMHDSFYTGYFWRQGRGLIPEYRPDGSTTKVTDLFFQAVIRLVKAGRHLGPAATYLNTTLLQRTNIQYRSAFYSGAKELIWSIDLAQADQIDHGHLKRIQSDVLAVAADSISLNPNLFVQYLTEQIQQTNQPVEAAKLLELTRYIQQAARASGFWRDPAIKEKLTAALEPIASQAPNYLIRLRARQLLTGLDQPLYLSFRQQRAQRAYQIAPGMIGQYDAYGKLESFQQTDEEDEPAELGTAGRFNRPVSELPLFVPSQQAETEATVEARQAQRQDFLFLLSPDIQEQIKADFGFNLNQLDLRVQQYFSHFLSQQNIEQVQAVMAATQRFGPDFLTCFVAQEENQAAGQQILEIARTYEPAVAQAIFRQYRALFASTEQIRQFLPESATHQPAMTQQLEDRIIRELLAKAAQLLNRYSNTHVPTETILADLQAHQAELQTFHSAYRAIQAQGELQIPLEAYQGIRIEALTGLELYQNAELVDQLKTINQLSWQAMGDEGALVMADFAALLKDPERLAETTFHIIRHGEQVMAFLRLDQREDGSRYLASVHTRPQLAGARIGEALLDQVLTQEGANRLITAECNPLSPISSRYIGRMKFVARRLSQFAVPDDTFEISRDDRPEQRERYKSIVFAGKGYEELVSLLPRYQEKGEEPNQVSKVLLQYRLPEEYSQDKDEKPSFTTMAHRLLAANPDMVITAWAREKRPANGDQSYNFIVGFERLTNA